jgi:DNA-binding PadR family transcriptional regulator
MANDSTLGYALLGLIHVEPRSGYDLRKVFVSSAMGSFSDSPGAIYPALTRLEKQGKIRGEVEESRNLRRKRIYSLTPNGLAAFRAWLRQPITRDDIMRRMGDLMLRFAFMEGVATTAEIARFLRHLESEIAAYIPTLRAFIAAHGSEMPLSARLALECGIHEYSARLEWARSSAVLFEREKETVQ